MKKLFTATVAALLSTTKHLTAAVATLPTTKLFTAAAATLLSTAFISCSSDSENEPDDLIWDFAPINFYVTVSDTQGNDLLNPNITNSLADVGIKVEVDGKTYCKDSLAITRAYLAHFYGAITHIDDNGKYYLKIGEFAGDENCEKKEIIIDWNDGSKKDTLSFSNSLKWEGNDPKIARTFYLNNQEVTSPTINFTKSFVAYR